jgi:glycosyltransferase involved in cell wall biosynthesis
MASASLFVFPSLHEGFGLPVIEAMRMGAPVVTSNTTALPEVGGDAAFYVDPLSVEEIAQAMRSVLSTAGLAEQMRERGLRQAQNFTWRQCCEDVIHLCHETAGDDCHE